MSPGPSSGRPPALISASTLTRPAIWSTNQASYLHAAWTSATESPARNAWAMTSTRSGRGAARAARTASFPAPSMATSLRPLSPISRERRPFCSDSGKLRPMAMTSPTDFIDVVKRGSVPGNFSKVKRGILVTT